MAQQLFELLKKDHRQVEQMMREIIAADEEERQELFQPLRNALNEHFQIEEKYFYPRIKTNAEMKELVQDALEEHKEAKDYLLELEEMETHNHAWQETFQKMQQGILHHVQDEEHKIFPKCTKVLTDQQLKEIGQQCAQEKQKAHPARKAAPASRARTTSRKQPHA